MAHRKLQQEIDRVFKKINEGLEIFNTYYERHENCTNNPSQKDKLESDLKREVKKLQRLREQIKSWQSSPEVKDKDSLLEYRRSVEVAMEKYKAVEKASKEKAYSNNSLKRSEVLEPEEQERRDVSDYLSEKIEELERQYDQLQVELDKLIVGKKKRSGTSANEERRQELKGLQGRYRWHQQQMELALRLLANEELHPQNVRDIQDDISYFIESNQEPDFVEDETIYESLNLEANEAIAHEVAASFAAQMAEENDEEYSKDSSKLSKKEQRRLEREAKKAAKLAAVTFTNDSMGSTPVTSAPSSAMDSELVEHDQNSTSPSSPSVAIADEPSSTPKSSPSPSPTPTTSSSIPSTANTTNTHCQPSKPQTPLPIKQSSQISHLPTESQGHTHIHQSLNGVTTSTLKPATVPAKPAGELKWAVAAAQALEKEKREKSILSPVLPKKQINYGPMAQGDSAINVTGTITTSINNVATAGIATRTPTIATVNMSNANGSSSSLANSNNFILHTSPNSSNVIQPPFPYLEGENGADASEQHQDVRSPTKVATSNSLTVGLKSGQPGRLDRHPIDPYVSEPTDDELEEEPVPLQLDAEECERRQKTTEQLTLELCRNFELLRLPIGIQDLIVGSLITENSLQIPDGKQGGFRNFRDICRVNRLLDIPLGLSPPQPLDACRCSEQWDYIRVSNITDNDFYPNAEDTKNAIYEKFRMLETFTLFYNYYYAYTPLEHEIAATILTEREWRVSKDGVTWFFREGQPKFTNELCEVADFKVFKLDDWTAMTKLNYTLDYSTLKTPPTLHSISGTSDSEKVRQGSVSYGQTFLEQLKQGSSAMKVEASH